MPWSLTLMVSSTLAIAYSGLLPSDNNSAAQFEKLEIRPIFGEGQVIHPKLIGQSFS
jgi:hypothetical protein